MVSNGENPARLEDGGVRELYSRRGRGEGCTPKPEAGAHSHDTPRERARLSVTDNRELWCLVLIGVLKEHTIRLGCFNGSRFNGFYIIFS